MMHTIRLLQSALQILETGKLNIRAENREELLSIKNGDKDYDELLNYAETLMNKLNSASKNSNLPDFPDKEKINSILVKMRSELYKSTY